MMCDHCGQPLKPGEDEEVLVYGGSGAGATMHLHRGGCPTEPPVCSQPRTYPLR